MKWSVLILLAFVCLACGGMLPEKVVARKALVKSQVEDKTAIHQRLYLKVLEAKYLKEQRNLNLAIVRGMIVELEGRGPASALPDSLPDLKELRKNPAFLSLELTIEHLSHRESVKHSSRHSAFLNARP